MRGEMKEIFRTVLILSLAALVLAGQGACQINRTGSNDEETIIKIIHDSFAWAMTKDRALFESIFAKDDDFFAFYPDSKSTVVGWAQFQKYLDRWMDKRSCIYVESYCFRDITFSSKPRMSNLTHTLSPP